LSTPQLVEHFFRHEYGRLVAIFVRKVGVQHIDIIEDSVQSALMAALDSWMEAGVPEKYSAWLFKVAHNNLIDELRKQTGRDLILEKSAEEIRGSVKVQPDYFFSSELDDDLLRMLFMCCDNAIAIESQLALALKTLCGFSVSEIAERLFINESNVYKRLSRAKFQLKKISSGFRELSQKEYTLRLSGVAKTLYLLFTEGYLSSSNEEPIRRDLCHEAIRLTTILATHRIGEQPEIFALLALMHLHIARMNARQNGTGGLILLEEQDRASWDMCSISQGMYWLEQSAQGECFSRYHAEAGIAAEHCLAPSFEQTRWDKIVENYVLLERIAPSALHRLNRAVAVAQWQGPSEGLAIAQDFEFPAWLMESYLLNAVLADLHRRCGHSDKAWHYFQVAQNLAPTEAIKLLLQRRLNFTDASNV